MNVILGSHAKGFLGAATRKKTTRLYSLSNSQRSTFRESIYVLSSEKGNYGGIAADNTRGIFLDFVVLSSKTNFYRAVGQWARQLSHRQSCTLVKSQFHISKDKLMTTPFLRWTHGK